MWILRRARPITPARILPLLPFLPLFLFALWALPARAQTAEQVAFDRPEAWALKYFAAATTFTGLSAPRDRASGKVEVGFEGGWIPYLSESQRRVGFQGTALEDLNKTPVFARPRVLIGLPAGVALDLGWIPPVTLNGGKANLFDAALEKAFFDTKGGSFGLRLYGQLGHAKGDFTCSEDVVAQPPGSAGNPQGCDQRSADTASLKDAGAALSGGIRLGRSTLHLAGGATYNDLQFQAGASRNGNADNTALTTHGWTYWVAAGADFPIGRRVTFAVEGFYSPLRVKRPPATESENDGLFNARAMLRWAVN